MKNVDFNNFIDAATLFDQIQSKRKKNQLIQKKKLLESESKVNNVKIGGKRSDKQRSEIENISNLYAAYKEVIKFYEDYPTTIFLTNTMQHKEKDSKY